MKKILLTLCFAAAAIGAQAAAPCTPVGLRCEHLETPLGIDAPAPRLGWRLDDSRSGALQRAYRVVVGRDSAAVAAGCGDVWDSGRTDSDGMLVRYAGPKLDPFTRYYWAVTVWDKDYARSSSGVAAFETGMMGAGNWQGCWISDHHDINHKPAPYFRKEFSVGKRVKSARAYVAAAGLYELHINGRKVGDHRLDPMYTRFDRRNLYVTYDVTRQLQDGANAVGILLGNGWYNHQSGAVWNFERAPWRNRPAFCFDLRIEYADGTHEVVKSDLDWRTSGGPLVFNSIYTSEHYDARLEQPGWSAPGFDDSAWGGVMYRGAPSQRVTAQQTVPIRNVTQYRPRSVRKLDDAYNRQCDDIQNDADRECERLLQEYEAYVRQTQQQIDRFKATYLEQIKASRKRLASSRHLLLLSQEVLKVFAECAKGLTQPGDCMQLELDVRMDRLTINRMGKVKRQPLYQKAYYDLDLQDLPDPASASALCILLCRSVELEMRMSDDIAIRQGTQNDGFISLQMCR